MYISRNLLSGPYAAEILGPVQIVCLELFTGIILLLVNMFELVGKTALVTGAARRIGVPYPLDLLGRVQKSWCITANLKAKQRAVN